MLKPKYRNISESVEDFNLLLKGMNRIQPLEKSFDEDLQELFREEQELVRLEQRIDHAHRAIAGSGMQISEEEARDLASMHSHAANMYSTAANKASHRADAAKRSGNPAMFGKMKDVHDRLRRMAGEHQAKAKKQSNDAVISDSVQSLSPVDRLRALAGITERANVPRDPSHCGTTRHNYGSDATYTRELDADELIAEAANRIRGFQEGRSKDQQAAGLEATLKKHPLKFGERPTAKTRDAFFAKNPKATTVGSLTNADRSHAAADVPDDSLAWRTRRSQLANLNDLKKSRR